MPPLDSKPPPAARPQSACHARCVKNFGLMTPLLRECSPAQGPQAVRKLCSQLPINATLPNAVHNHKGRPYSSFIVNAAHMCMHAHGSFSTRTRSAGGQERTEWHQMGARRRWHAGHDHLTTTCSNPLNPCLLHSTTHAPPPRNTQSGIKWVHRDDVHSDPGANTCSTPCTPACCTSQHTYPPPPQNHILALSGCTWAM